MPPAMQKERPSLVIVRPTLGQGGADRVTLTLLENLERAELDTTLLLFRREGPYLDDVPETVPIAELGAGSLWTAWWPLVKYLRESAPDILFSTCSGTNVVASIANLLTGHRARLVLSERNVLIRDQPFLKKWTLLVAKRLLYPFADCLTAVSTGVADDLVDRLELDPERVRVVFNPVVGPDIPALAGEPLDEPPFDVADPVVLAAGRLVPAKGFDVLLRAFARVAPTRRCNLVILGDGPLRDALLQEAEDLGIRDRLFLPGFVKNPFKYMARATVFVLSSKFEGLPGVLIQAMACGAAVLSTRCPAGPDEIITHDRDGLLVPVDSVEDMVRELQRLLENHDLRDRLGAAARERVQSYAIGTVVESYKRAVVGEAECSPDSVGSPWHTSRS